MAATSLSRSSFYVYFRDRYDLLLQVVQEIAREVMAMAERWFAGGGDPVAEVRFAVEGVVAVYAEHGPVMRAIADAAPSDPLVEQVYNDLIAGFVSATGQRIQDDIRAGASAVTAEPGDLAFALGWMTERYLVRSFGSTSERVDRDSAVATLVEIWTRALYADAPR